MLGLKLVHINKRGPWCIYNSSQVVCVFFKFVVVWFRSVYHSELLHWHWGSDCLSACEVETTTEPMFTFHGMCHTVISPIPPEWPATRCPLVVVDLHVSGGTTDIRYVDTDLSWQLIWNWHMASGWGLGWVAKWWSICIHNIIQSCMIHHNSQSSCSLPYQSS